MKNKIINEEVKEMIGEVLKEPLSQILQFLKKEAGNAIARLVTKKDGKLFLPWRNRQDKQIVELKSEIVKLNQKLSVLCESVDKAFHSTNKEIEDFCKECLEGEEEVILEQEEQDSQ